MREMKDSGIEWIGYIPIKWAVERLQWHIQEVNEANNPIRTQAILSLTNTRGVIPYEDKGEQGNKAKENLTGYKIAYPNTIVANSMNIIIGSVGLSCYMGCVSPVYYVFRCANKFTTDIRYINYLFSIQPFQKELRKYANGILEIRLRVSANDILKRMVCAPFLSEQRSIVTFLDSKCAKLDALSTDIQAQIDTLTEYKVARITELVTIGLQAGRILQKSDIAWIPRIPDGWKVSKLKYEIIPVYRAVYASDDVVTCFRDGQVTLRKNRREDGFTVSFTEDGYHGVDIGDLVIHGMDTFAGAIGCSDSRGKCTPVVHVCRTTGNNRYYMYLLRSMANNGVLWFYANGVRVRSSDFRNYSNLGKFMISVPPVAEQDEIAANLDTLCAEVDATIEQKRQQLATLAEYKKSLIYEYVTGKKEVV